MKAYLNEKEGSLARSAVGHLQNYSNKTVSTMKCGVFVMYLVHDVLQEYKLSASTKAYFQCTYTCEIRDC